MGGDFTYQDAAMWYKNIDKLIEYANMKAAKDGLNIKLFYSTPDCYLKAVRDSNPTLPTKQDDFFPYASDPTAYWTGYFTSRPTTKYFERQGNDYLQMVKHLQVLTGLPEHNKFVLDELRSAMGVMQHHDAITGTEKQHVAHDYERLLDEAIEDALIIAREAFNKIVQKDALKLPLFTYDRCRFNESSCPTSENSDQFVVTIYNPLGWNILEPIRIPVLKGVYEVFAPNGQQIESQLLEIPDAVKNIPTRKSEATHELIFIAKLHPLGVKSFYIKKINSKTKRDVATEEKDKRRNDLYININDYWKNIRDRTYIDIRNMEEDNEKLNIYNNDNDQSYFPINNEPLEEKVPILINNNNDYITNKDKDEISEKDIDLLKDKQSDVNVGEIERILNDVKEDVKKGNVERKIYYPKLNADEMRMLSDEPQIVERSVETYLENEFMKLRIDEDSGQITHMILSDRTLNLRIQFYYWTGASGDNTDPSKRSSGAYIFRPITDKPFATTLKNTKTIKGNIVSEIRAETNENAHNVVRIYKGLEFFEHDFVVGPIDVKDNVGKEFVVRYETNIANNGAFYTDSNGRQMVPRKLNERPQWNLTLKEPIAGNYYPVTNKIVIEDNDSRFAVLTDRSEGGSVLEDGNVELMVHRRLLHDDAFGVGEALNEEASGKGLVVRGKHRIVTHNPNNDDQLILERKLVYQTHLEPLVFVSNAEKMTFENWLTLNNCFKGSKELPLGLHLLTLEPWNESQLLIRFENFKEKSNNSTIELDLTAIFNNLKIKSIKETTLAANQWLKDVEGKKWGWNTESELSDDNEEIKDGLKIKIRAKQIRTFIADYEYINK